MTTGFVHHERYLWHDTRSAALYLPAGGMDQPGTIFERDVLAKQHRPGAIAERMVVGKVGQRLACARTQHLGHLAATGRDHSREPLLGHDRSGEPRVGKECRTRWSPYH